MCRKAPYAPLKVDLQSTSKQIRRRNRTGRGRRSAAHCALYLKLLHLGGDTQCRLTKHVVANVGVFFAVSEEEEHNCDLQYVPKTQQITSFVHHILAFLTLRFATGQKRLF